MLFFNQKRVYSLRKTGLGVVSMAIGLLLSSPIQVFAFNDIVEVSNEAELIEAFQMKEDTSLNREILPESDLSQESTNADTNETQSTSPVNLSEENPATVEENLSTESIETIESTEEDQGIDFSGQDYSETRTEVIKAPEQKKQFENYRTIRLLKDIVLNSPLVLQANNFIKLIPQIDANQSSVRITSNIFNNDSSSLGESLITVNKNSKLVIEGKDNQSLVIDGGYQAENEATQTNVTRKGQLLTVYGDAEINGATFTNTYNSGMSTAPIYVEGGNLVINNILIENNIDSSGQTIGNVGEAYRKNLDKSGAKSAGIAVTGFGYVTMNNGEISNNKHMTGAYGSGAVAINQGTFILNDGIIAKNVAERAGGVAVNYQGRFVMNGGSIEENQARYAGGGIFAFMASSIQMNGGKISRNQAGSLGGGVAIYDEFSEGASGTRQLSELAIKNGFTWEDHNRWRQFFDAKFEMNQGEITDNYAYVGGGGIYVASSGVQINAGNISNNKSLTYGGGIYVSSVPYVLQLKNVYFENNSAIPQYGTYLLSSQMLEGHGGAVWFCPTGESQIFESNGASFNDNTGQFSGDDFTLTQGGDYRLSSYFGQRLLGGGKLTWYIDGHPTDKSISRYLADQGQIFIDKVPEKLTDPISLKAVADDEAAIALAKKLSKVIMVGNISSRGGAIGSNGSVIIGDKDKTFNLKVNKKWDESLKEQIKDVELIIDLYNMMDPDHPVLIDTIRLNQANQFSASFEDLPLEAGNQKINYQLRERNNQDYQTTYSLKNIEQNQEGSYEIGEKVTAELEIYNKPKPEDPVPEDPTPEDPVPENPTPEDPTPEDPVPEDPIPEDPTPEDPIPEQPKEPELPKVEPPIKVETMQIVGQLPATGEADSKVWLLTGALAMITGALSLFKRRQED